MKAKLLYLITEDWFFCSHFFERAIAAQKSGFEVVVIAREQAHGNRIRSAGLNFVALPFKRRGLNFFKEFLLLLKIFNIYRRERPTIVHQIGAKPILYGSIAAMFVGVRAIVNAPIGMGYVFSSNDYMACILRPFVRLAYRFFINLSNSKVIFENKDDLAEFIRWRAVSTKDAILIRGAGVDIKRFYPVDSYNEIPVIMLIARMLKDKGVNEFVMAAHRLYDENIKARFVLVGGPDPINPTSLTEEELSSWNGNKGVEWWGWREDVVSVLHQASIVCLPSYREGLPKALLEAAACGLPIVTTDAVGCREVVIDSENGFLVPVKDVEALILALKKLIIDPFLRRRMGENGRIRAETEFSSSRIIAETLAIYNCFTM